MNNPRTIDLVVGLLGATVLLGMTGMLLLAALGKTAPEMLAPVTTGALTALGAVLVNPGTPHKTQVAVAQSAEETAVEVKQPLHLFMGISDRRKATTKQNGVGMVPAARRRCPHLSQNEVPHSS